MTTMYVGFGIVLFFQHFTIY